MRPRTGEAPLEPRHRPAAAHEADAVDAALATAGDVAAFERLYRRHVARIHALCVRMTHPDEAEECTQEVFVRAWTKLEGFRGDSQFGTWLYRLAINTVLTIRGKRGRYQERVVTAEDEVLERAPAPAARGGTRIDLEKAVRSLPERARDVFVLHDVEGFRHEEIAEMLSINIGTSKSQLHRARMLLRESLSR